MNDLEITEYNGFRVVTTKQIAEIYGVTPKKVSNNFNANKKRYTEGKHYFVLEGNDAKDLQSRISGLQNFEKVRKLYLWTERGALLIAKSINTDIAWEAYERLVDFYFEKKTETKNELQVIEQPPVQLIPDYHTSTTPVPKALTWYQRNKRRIEFLVTEGHVERRTLYHHILLRISEEYDIDAARDIYADEHNGMYPKYSIDIVSYFPELAEVADRYLDCLERQLKRKLGMIKD